MIKSQLRKIIKEELNKEHHINDIDGQKKWIHDNLDKCDDPIKIEKIYKYLEKCLGITEEEIVNKQYKKDYHVKVNYDESSDAYDLTIDYINGEISTDQFNKISDIGDVQETNKGIEIKFLSKKELINILKVLNLKLKI